LSSGTNAIAVSKAAEAHIIILSVLPNVSLPALYNFTDGLLAPYLNKVFKTPYLKKNPNRWLRKQQYIAEL